MTIREAEEHQRMLESILRSMAKEPLYDSVDLLPYADKLLKVYTADFRHSYALFFPLIVEMADEKNSYDIQFLSESLYNIQKCVEQEISKGDKKYSSLSSPLSKLSDHLRLEIARYTQYTKYESRMADLSSQNETLETTLTRVESALTDVKKTAADVEAKTSNMQTEYTTILGIFAAIILAFTGSFSFSSSVLENIHQASVYRLIIITLIVGFVTFNIICALFDFITRINNKKWPPNKSLSSVKSPEAAVDTSCAEGTSSSETGKTAEGASTSETGKTAEGASSIEADKTGKVKTIDSFILFLKQNWGVVGFNCVIILGIIATCFAYKINFFEVNENSDSPGVINEASSEGLTTSESSALFDTEENISQQESE